MICLNWNTVGAYWYTYAKTCDEAIKEANKFLEVIKDKQFSYPIYLDIEDNSLINIGKENLDNIISTFAKVIEDAGYYFGIYTNLNWYKNIISGDKLNKKYDWWIAYWGNNKPSNIDFGIWQTSSSYRLGNNNIDSNYSYKDYPNIIRKSNLNHLNNNTKNNTNNDCYIVKKGDTFFMGNK